MNRSAALLLSILVPAGLAFAPNAATAQERIQQVSTPDISVYEAILPMGERWKRQRSGEGTSAAWSLGAGFGTTEGESGGVAAGSVALGYRSPSLLIGGRSELTGFIPAEGEALDLAKTRGIHRALVIYHMGERRDDYALSLSADGWARHSGGQPFRLDSLRYGTAPLKTGGGKFSANLGTGDHDVRVVVPVTGKFEETRWDEGPLAGARSKALGMGFGIQPGERENVRGSVDFVAAEVEHTQFDRRAAFSAADGVAGGGTIADEFRKVRLGSGVSNLTFFDREALGTFTGRFGWAWLESDVASQTTKYNGFDFQLGVNFQIGDPGDYSRYGFAFSRSPDRTADGSRITSEWRAELSSDYNHDRVDIGVRGGLSWLAAKESADGGDEPTILRYGTQLEGFYKLPLDFQVGGYLATSYEPQGTFDPWAIGASWNSEMGVLLRWKRPGKEGRSYTKCGYEPEPTPPVRIIAH